MSGWQSIFIVSGDQGEACDHRGIWTEPRQGFQERRAPFGRRVEDPVGCRVDRPSGLRVGNRSTAARPTDSADARGETAAREGSSVRAGSSPCDERARGGEELRADIGHVTLAQKPRR